jgi:hypothetical protein
MNEVIWTTEKPTEPGYYWVKERPLTRPILVSINIKAWSIGIEELAVLKFGDETHYDASCFAFFSQKIERPESGVLKA